MYYLRQSLFCIILLSAASMANAQSKCAQKVLEAESHRFEAMTRADTGALREMLADELVYVHSNAMQESKKEHLAAIGSQKLVYKKMERQDAQVRIYGKTALVNGKVKVQGVLNGNNFELNLLYLAAYRKIHKSWKLVHWQSTRVP